MMAEHNFCIQRATLDGFQNKAFRLVTQKCKAVLKLACNTAKSRVCNIVSLTKLQSDFRLLLLPWYHHLYSLWCHTGITRNQRNSHPHRTLSLSYGLFLGTKQRSDLSLEVRPSDYFPLVISVRWADISWQIGQSLGEMALPMVIPLRIKFMNILSWYSLFKLLNIL